MARSRNKKNKNKQMVQRRSRAPQPSAPLSRSYGLDKAAVEWMRLLDDPCSGKLVYPCYPNGSGGSVLVRVEADSILWNGATDTCGFGLWVPGAGMNFVNSVSLVNDGTVAEYARFDAVTAGYSFLTGQGASYRPVAACLQLSYPGSELTRAGVASFGVIDATSEIGNLPLANGGRGTTFPANAARVACQHVQRMPQDVMEIKWFPGEEDMRTKSCDVLATDTNWAQRVAGCNGIRYTASGFPINTGIRVRTVCIYECTLDTANAGVVNSLRPSVSLSTPNSILKYMSDKDPQWYLSAAKRTAGVLGSIINYIGQGPKSRSNLLTY